MFPELKIAARVEDDAEYSILSHLTIEDRKQKLPAKPKLTIPYCNASIYRCKEDFQEQNQFSPIQMYSLLMYNCK